MAQSKEGAAKVAAFKLGLELDEYKARIRNEKWCYSGKHWASRTDFNKDASRRDGLSLICHDCLRAKALYTSRKGSASTLKSKRLQSLLDLASSRVLTRNTEVATEPRSEINNNISSRSAYPSDVADEEWRLLLPYLTLIREDAGQRQYPLRELFNALRYLVHTGCGWQYLPHDLPPWSICYHQWKRWSDAHCFEALSTDLRFALYSQRYQSETDISIVTPHLLPNREDDLVNYVTNKRRRGNKLLTIVNNLEHLLTSVANPINQTVEI